MEVLLVERSPVLLVRLARFLTEMPYVHIVAVEDRASNACEIVQDMQPDILVFDLDTAGDGGVHLLRQLRAQGNAPYVIALTGDATPEYRDRCLEVADLCLDKAHDMDALVEAVKRCATELVGARAKEDADVPAACS